jgi:hypothetical protein
MKKVINGVEYNIKIVAAWDAEKAAWDAACATKSDDKTAFEAAWADYDVAKAALVAALAAVSA